MPDQGVISIRCVNGFETTLAAVEQVLAQRGAILFAKVDHAAGARAVGQDLAPTTLLLFGAPKAGTPVMQAQRTMGLDLPLRALVWEERGTVWLSYEDPLAFAARHALDEEVLPSLNSMAAMFEALHAAVQAPRDAAQAPARTVARAHDSGPGVLRGAVEAAEAAFVVDEPVSNGGTELGPSPHTVLASALAACTALTVRSYADRKGWPLRSVSVSAEHVRQEGQTPADLFRRTITLDGPVDSEQAARMLEIADRCPVHLTLTRGSRVETSAD